MEQQEGQEGYDAHIQNASAILSQGGVVVYPTDTVYGLGADATNAHAVGRIRTIKGRAADTPILAMVRNVDMLRSYAELTPLAEALAAALLPGQLTLVLTPRNDALTSIAAPDGSVGFRIPDHPLCAALSTSFERPITSTSVNRSGMPQPRTLSAMLDQLKEASELIDYTFDSGTLPASPPSTIVDVRGDTPLIVREGAISSDHIIHIIRS